MTLLALIFDVDGTLAETEEAHRDAFNQTFAEFGIAWTWDQPLYRQLLKTTGGKERILAYARDFDPAHKVEGLDAMVPRLHKRKTELYTARVAAGAVPLRPGVAELIAEARAAGLKLGIATTTSRANVVALLDGATHGHGHEWFQVMVCGEDAPVKKPDPSVYVMALKRLELPATACLALEDSTNGVRAARGAGIPVVVSESVYTEGDDFSGALKVWPDFAAVRLAELSSLHSLASS
ncbi:MAG: HAD-IA family hydrolase [Actinomycetota bacterium]